MKRVLLLFIFLILANVISAQNESRKRCIRIYYETASTLNMNPSFENNKEAIASIDSILYSEDTIIDFTDIISYNCPTGSIDSNITICNKRTNNIVELLLQNKYKKRFKIVPHKNVCVTWNNLAKILPTNVWLPNNNALNIMKGNGNDSIKKSKIIALDMQQTYSYLKDNYFAKLRYTDIFFTYHVKNQSIIKQIEPSKKKTDAKIDSKKTQMQASTLSKSKAFPFTVKTNLLYDILGIFNLGVEAPIHNKWSIVAEMNYSGSFSGVKQRSIQLCWGNIEGRYWFGNRTISNKMTGLFAGVYTSGGVYDLEWREKGYQGNYYSFGLSGGYVYKIGKEFSIENSLNVGFLHTKYDKYNATLNNADNSWTLVRDYRGTFNWFGPTMLKVSLVWCPSFKHKTTKL